MSSITDIFSTEVKQPKLGVLHWVSKITGEEGRSSIQGDYETLMWRANMALEDKDNDLLYWVEPVLEEDET